MMVSMKRLTDPSGRRFVSIGMGIKALMLVVVYSYRGMRIRIVSARPATPHECAYHEEGQGSKIGRHAAAHSPGRDSGCKLNTGILPPPLPLLFIQGQGQRQDSVVGAE
jgi:Ribonuclease toxin, BrnT, of type II toxin-antitoxin system